MAKNNVLEQFGIKDSSDLHVIGKADNLLALILNYANSISLNITADSVSAKSKGTDVLTWELPRTGELQITSSITSLAALAVQFGAKVTNGRGDLFKKETLTGTSSTTYTLSETPKVGTLCISTLLDDNASIDKNFKVITGGSPQKGEVLLADKQITFASGDITSGDKIFGCYLTEKATGVFTFAVASLGKGQAYKIYGDTKTKCVTNGKEDFVQIHFHNVEPNSTTEISFDSENPSGFDMTFKVNADQTKLDENGNPEMFRIVSYTGETVGLGISEKEEVKK